MFSRVIIAPAVEPLSLAEIKLDRGVEHTLHDDLLTALIRSAREYVENYCSLSLVTQTRELILDQFDAIVVLPYGPVQSVSSVAYIDTNGVTQTLASTDWIAVVNRYAATVTSAYSKYFPATRYEMNAVTITYVAGYAPLSGSPTDYASNIPPGVLTAMKLLIGSWYENREATSDRPQHEVPLAVAHLLGQHRTSWL